jgi:predicted nucleotidyltransferase
MEEGPRRRRVKTPGEAASICRALNDAGASYLLIGGVACILHGHVRATTDIDILILRTDENARRLLEGLATVGYGFARDWTPKELLARPVTVIGDSPAVDVFTVAWSVQYEGAIAHAVSVNLEGVTVSVIGIDDLIATKRTGRLKDAADIEVLEEIKRLRAG